MWMKNSDVIRSYLQAENPERQIKVLSELNACTKEEICNILKTDSKAKALLIGEKGVKKAGEESKDKTIELLREEVINAYRACRELEKENNKLQHDVLEGIHEIIRILTEK